MNRFVVVLVSVLSMLMLSAASAPATAPKKPPKLKDTTIVEGQSLGGVKLGGTKASAVKAWGKPGTCGSSTCDWPNYKGGLGIVLLRGKIIGVIASFTPAVSPAVRARIRPLRTTAGAKLLDTLDRVKQLYPAARGFSVGAEVTLPALEVVSGATYTDFFFDLSKKLTKITIGTQSAAHPL